jgi:hypothetical protein
MEDIIQAVARLRRDDLIRQARHRQQVRVAQHGRGGWAVARAVAGRLLPWLRGSTGDRQPGPGLVETDA